MEIFIPSLPNETTESALEGFLRPYLEKLSIFTYSCYKRKGQTWAKLTVVDKKKGKQFLHNHISSLFFEGRPMTCRLSDRSPDPVRLRVLEKMEKDRLQAQLKAKPSKSTKERSSHPIQRKFRFNSLACGVWDYQADRLVFICHATENSEGHVTFGRFSLILDMRSSRNGTDYKLVMPYTSFESITTSTDSLVSISISLYEAPKFYASEDTNLEVMFRGLSFKSFRNHPRTSGRKRVTDIPGFSKTVLSRCFVYRIGLNSSKDREVLAALSSTREIPRSFSVPSSMVRPDVSFKKEMADLQNCMANWHNRLEFPLQFQILRLAENGYLPPGRVIDLLPQIFLMLKKSGTSTAIEAIKRLYNQIPYPGPKGDSQEYSMANIKVLLSSNETWSNDEAGYRARFEKKNKHLTLVHHVIVTPTGTYLSGPAYEASNRVLRKYAGFSDFFLRVSFLDESWEPIRFDRLGSNDPILHGRFKSILRETIRIAGRGFQFLGFSHSALRSQTCWFMAPFTFDGRPLFAQDVIRKLGDFAQSRCPAKCAARIGQAFSETSSPVKLPDNVCQEISDVEKHGRVFSDGVGTFSEDILIRIREEFGRNTQCNVFQIRHAGAKGMISLDNRLQGEVLRLRRSMIKFEGSSDNDIEICDGATRPLPFYLNRQLIKVLEDLGVSNSEFLNLQNEAVMQLRRGVKSNPDAAKFLEQNSVGEAARLPWLLRKLYALGLSFKKDPFLCDTVEMAVLMRLRELKHKSRIQVPEAVTLYGIMDETDFLKENQVYCTFTQDGRRKELDCQVMVTRSPALHPGDVQVARAVPSPDSSPLKALANCVAFSQRGERDLPSKLSGGDLDGDLYNIVWQPGLIPPTVYSAADYPRVEQMDLGRTVTSEDMSDFFIQFMESDQLGRIATTHVILADQCENGTLDEKCLRLADMHSNAVDFSKSGVPVDMSKLPKHIPARPDFMITGPEVRIAEGIRLEDIVEEAERSAVVEEENEGPKYEYYESAKVLGKLYRAINESEIFQDLQQSTSSTIEARRDDRAIIRKVWEHVSRKIPSTRWKRYVSEARQIRERYEENLVDVMYEFSTRPNNPLHELEVFIGYVIGKNGAQSRRQRECSIGLKKKFEVDVSFTVDSIRSGVTGSEDGGLERSTACLSLSMERTRRKQRAKAADLRSFEWLAAAVCLKEVDSL